MDTWIGLAEQAIDFDLRVGSRPSVVVEQRSSEVIATRAHNAGSGLEIGDVTPRASAPNKDTTPFTATTHGGDGICQSVTTATDLGEGCFERSGVKDLPAVTELRQVAIAHSGRCRSRAN